MKTITVHLPDFTYETAISEAKRLKLEVSAYCSLSLAEKLGDIRAVEIHITPNVDVGSTSVETTVLEAAKLDVATNFTGYPRTAVELAQGFVDAALTFPGVRAFKNNRGSGIEPNFVFIEYLRSRGKPGIVASFCAPPEALDDASGILLLKPGRGKYTRVDITTHEELKAVIPLISQAWEWRFAK